MNKGRSEEAWIMYEYGENTKKQIKYNFHNRSSIIITETIVAQSKPFRSKIK